jgi:hypothetical protein
MKRTDPIRVGDVFYGYCEGVFGRESYGEKRVEAIGGDWLVFREGDHPGFFVGDVESLRKYREKPEGWDDG